MNKEFLKMQKIAGLITENQVKEMEIDDNGNDKFDIIDGLVGRDLYDNFINAVEAIQDATIGQAGIESQDVYDYLTDSMLRDA